MGKKKPVKKTVIYVKSVKDILKALANDGYYLSSDGGFLNNSGFLNFNVDMFAFCGKQQPDEYAWYKGWLEERKE